MSRDIVSCWVRWWAGFDAAGLVVAGGVEGELGPQPPAVLTAVKSNLYTSRCKPIEKNGVSEVILTLGVTVAALAFSLVQLRRQGGDQPLREDLDEAVASEKCR
jgi:hypothetical protein